MKKYIGIDLGGTNVRVATVDEKGRIVNQVKSASYAQEGRDAVLTNLVKVVQELPDWSEAAAIGAGVPGPVDQKSGSMVLSTNMPGFQDFPLAKFLKDQFGKPAFLDNDANVAALAEALYGAGKGLSVVFYTTLSTGIGSGLVVDGKVVSGKHGFTGEVANVVIDRGREKVNYLTPGAVENEASGTAITRKGRALLPEAGIQHAGMVFDLARQGNEIAQAIADRAEGDLAQFFATVGGILDPDIFVLGGGMTRQADDWLAPMIEKYKAITHVQLHDTPFALAEIGEPGLIGASLLPKSHGL